MEKTVPFLQQDQAYYGKNDFRPWSCGKKICFVITCIVLSPLILLLFILSALLMCCISFNDNQKSSLKVLMFEAWYKAPGKQLEVKATGEASSDIIISNDFIDTQHKLHACALGVSLRKSIEYTVEGHCHQGPHAAKIESDTDVDKPRYHLHGWTEPFDPIDGDEVWTCPARVAQWSALYSWSGALPKGLGWSALTQAIDLRTAPEVLGYLYLLEVSNPTFYEGASRIVKVGQKTVNCPDHTPETAGKIFARYGYQDAYYLGNMKTDGSEPDAYIFKGKTFKEATFKIVHAYRIMKP
jgi:hypothetical protein